MRSEFENPIEQVMFILGFKHDPRFNAALDAMKNGASPGTINAVDSFAIYAAIEANFFGWRRTLKAIHDELGSVPPSMRESFYELIVEEMSEKNYGGKWLRPAEIRPEHWVNLGAYSPVFRRGTEVFALPEPYFKLLSEVFE